MTTVTGSKDPDKASGPIDPKSVSPNDPDFLEMQSISAYVAEREAFIKTGAELVKAGLETYVEVAKLPFYELGGVGIETAASKIADVVQKAGEIRTFASEATEAAVEARRLAQEGKTGKSAEEVAKLEETATEAEKSAEEATKVATDAERTATSAQRRADGARRLAGHRQNLSPETLDAAQRELQGEVVMINPKDGEAFDHVEKVRQEQRGMMNRIEQLNKTLSVPNTFKDADWVADLNEELAENSKLLDLTEQFVPQQ